MLTHRRHRFLACFRQALLGLRGFQIERGHVLRESVDLADGRVEVLARVTVELEKGLAIVQLVVADERLELAERHLCRFDFSHKGERGSLPVRFSTPSTSSPLSMSFCAAFPIMKICQVLPRRSKDRYMNLFYLLSLLTFF